MCPRTGKETRKNDKRLHDAHAKERYSSMAEVEVRRVSARTICLACSLYMRRGRSEGLKYKYK
jgi:hypothetical protein